MSEEIVRASFEAKRSDINRMLENATAPFDDKYDQAWVNVQSDAVTTIANAGTAVAAYSTYDDPLVENIEVREELDDTGSEAIINVEEFKDYLNFVGGDVVEVEFIGSSEFPEYDEEGELISGEQLSKKVHLDGELSATIYIPSSKSDLESKMTSAVGLYNEDEEFIKPSNGQPLSTSFSTNVEQFQKIVKVTDFDDIVLDNYPVTVRDGQLILNATDKNARNEINGALYAEDVEGPDVSNHYSRGFEELFKTIDGYIDVRIEQDSAISIVKESDGMTNRYAILPTS